MRKRKAGHRFTSPSRAVIWTWSAFWSQMVPIQNRRTESDKPALVVRLFKSSCPMFAVLLNSFLDVSVYDTCGKQGQPITSHYHVIWPASLILNDTDVCDFL